MPTPTSTTPIGDGLSILSPAPSGSGGAYVVGQMQAVYAALQALQTAISGIQSSLTGYASEAALSSLQTALNALETTVANLPPPSTPSLAQVAAAGSSTTAPITVGGLTSTGTITGPGSGLTSLPAGQIQGQLPTASLATTGLGTVGTFLRVDRTWANVPTPPTPTLQSVTDAGAVTTDTLTVGGLTATGRLFVGNYPDNIQLVMGDGSVGGSYTVGRELSVDGNPLHFNGGSGNYLISGNAAISGRIAVSNYPDTVQLVLGDSTPSQYGYTVGREPSVNGNPLHFNGGSGNYLFSGNVAISGNSAFGGTSGHSYFDASGDLNVRSGQPISVLSGGYQTMSSNGDNGYVTIPYPVFPNPINARGYTADGYGNLHIWNQYGQYGHPTIIGDTSSSRSDNAIDMALPTYFRSTISIGTGTPVNVSGDGNGNAVFVGGMTIPGIVSLGPGSAAIYGEANGSVTSRNGITANGAVVAAGPHGLMVMSPEYGSNAFIVYGATEPLSLSTDGNQPIIIGDSQTIQTGSVIDMALPIYFRSTLSFVGQGRLDLSTNGYISSNPSTNPFGGFCITSPNGTIWQLQVDDSGNLSAVQSQSLNG